MPSVRGRIERAPLCVGHLQHMQGRHVGCRWCCELHGVCGWHGERQVRRNIELGLQDMCCRQLVGFICVAMHTLLGWHSQRQGQRDFQQRLLHVWDGALVGGRGFDVHGMHGGYG